jgi:5-methylcytosine-specific restriction endonuclease McrA
MSKARKPYYASVHKRYNRTVGGRYRQGRARAKRDGIPWTLAPSEYTYLISLSCHYCGQGLDPTGVGLDRMDSKEGYTRSNVVACCGQCNRLKGADLSEREFRILRKIMKIIQEE